MTLHSMSTEPAYSISPYSFPHVHFIPGSLPTGATHRFCCGRPRCVSAAPQLWASARLRVAGLCRSGRREPQETRRCSERFFRGKSRLCGLSILKFVGDVYQISELMFIKLQGYQMLPANIGVQSSIC